MKAFKPERIEVRVTREETETFLAGMEGSPEAFRHDLLVTQAMSVLLRAPDGGFTIESIAPETQWIFNRPGIADKEPFGRWRWSVTPTETGPHRLQLVVAARSVDQNGLPGDTPLPDQVVTVTTRVNYSRSLAKGAAMGRADGARRCDYRGGAPGDAAVGEGLSGPGRSAQTDVCRHFPALRGRAPCTYGG